MVISELLSHYRLNEMFFRVNNFFKENEEMQMEKIPRRVSDDELKLNIVQTT